MEDLNLSQLTKELNIWIELGTNDDMCTDDMASNIQQNTFNQIAADMCTNDPIAPSQTVSLGIDKSINETETDTAENELKSRGKARKYEFCTRYPTLKEAEEVLKIEKIWSRLSLRQNKITYRCNLAKYRGSRCRSQVQIHFTDTLEASISTTKIPFVQRQIQEIMMYMMILMTEMWMLMTL